MKSNTIKLMENINNNLNEEVKTMKERFKEFLDNNVKAEVYNFDAYLDDLTTQYGNTGSTQYELSSSESKSGNPELFDYELEELQNETGYGIVDEDSINETNSRELEFAELKSKIEKTGLYDFIANNYTNMDLDLLKEIALNAVYELNNDEAVLEDIKERMFE